MKKGTHFVSANKLVMNFTLSSLEMFRYIQINVQINFFNKTRLSVQCAVTKCLKIPITNFTIE